MWARGGVTQQANKTFFDVGADHVLPLAGFVVGALPRKPDDVDKETFGQPVATHDPRRKFFAFGGELELGLIDFQQ